MDYSFVSINKKWEPEENLDTMYLPPAYPKKTLSLPQLRIKGFSKNISFHKGSNIPVYCLCTALNLPILLKLWALKYGANRKCVNLLTKIQKPFGDLMFLLAQLYPAVKLDLLYSIYYELVHMYNNHFMTIWWILPLKRSIRFTTSCWIVWKGKIKMIFFSENDQV